MAKSNPHVGTNIVYPGIVGDWLRRIYSSEAAVRTRENSSAGLFRFPMTSEDLVGTWMDSYGNAVFVYWADTSMTQLTATLVRPPRPDIHLGLWQTPATTQEQKERDEQRNSTRESPGGGHHRLADNGWRCGDAVLDVQTSSAEQIKWIFPDGRVSVWKWCSDDLSYGMPYCGAPMWQYESPAFKDAHLCWSENPNGPAPLPMIA